jgi:hypothetical protein
MDDAKVLRACHLLHEALCDDLELKQLLVQVDQDRVSLTIHQKRGTKERKVIIGEDPASDTSILLIGVSGAGPPGVTVAYFTS